jgi:peptidyl-prolyl cis-trans isomerase SurA
MSVAFFACGLASTTEINTNINVKKESSISKKEYDGIIVVVNGDIITNEDLKARMNLALLSVGSNVTNDQMTSLTKEVLKEMINEKLKKQCVKKAFPNGTSLTINDVKDAFSDIAKNNNMTIEEFSKHLKSNGIAESVLLEQISVGLSWAEYIRARYGRNVNISESEMNMAIAEVKNKFNSESFYVHRMFFPVTNPAEEKSVLKHANNLMKMLKNGADFSNMARQFSKSADAKNGGELGWIFNGQLSDQEIAELKKMEAGSFAIVRNNRGYVILFLREKRSGGVRSFTDVKFTQIAISFGKQKPSKGDLRQLMNYLSDMRGSSKNCEELMQKAKDSGFMAVSDPMWGTIESMQPKFQPIFANIQLGGSSNPIVSDAGIVIICLLDKKIGVINEPTADEIKTQKISERLGVFSARELQDLKQKAYIHVSDKKYGSKAELLQ